MTAPYESEWLTRRKRINPQLQAAGWTVVPFDETRPLTDYAQHAIVAETPDAHRAEQNRRRDRLDLDRRLSAAQTRYLQAIKQLALVRKLLRPAPSALDLLKYPVNEGDAGAGAHTGPRRAGLGVQGVEN